MTNSDIQQLLARLRDELHNAELDAETQNMVRELDADIHAMLATPDNNAEPAGVMERAKTLEANFESQHPVATGVLREVMEALAKMGV